MRAWPGQWRLIASPYRGIELLMRVGTILQYLGISGLIVGVLSVLLGATPEQFFASFFQHPPAWLTNPFLAPGLAIFGLAIIAVSLRFNIWSRKQQVIDELAEDISFAIHNLVNRSPRPQTDDEIKKWNEDFQAWCAKVNRKLENRAFFTRADQLHFDRLGFIDPLFMTGHPKLDELLAQLRLKFDRLRDVINWTQQRRR
jgi:hypothetical protein